MKALPTVIVLLLWSLGWSLGFPQQSYRELSRRLDEAERLAAADRQESAAAQMARILERAGELSDRKVRRQLEKRAAKALKKCDKDHGAAHRASKSASKRLLTLARKYDKLDWHDSARRLAKLARELDAGSADKLLAKLPPPSILKPMDAKVLLQAGQSHPKGEPWSLLRGGLRSGNIVARAETHLVFAGDPTGDWKLQCHVHPKSVGGQVGILFAYRGTKTFHRVRIETDGKSLGMQLQSHDDGAIRTLYSVRIAVKRSELADGIPFKLSMAGRTLRIELGPLQPRVFVLPLESTVGKLGLWGVNTGKHSFRALFTKLEISR